MSNVWYDKLLTRVGKGLLNLNTLTDPKIIAVESSEYTFSQSHEYLSDLPAAARIAVANMVNTHFGTEVTGGGTPSPTDYVARWTMDDAQVSGATLLDTSGNNHTATMVNTPTTGVAGQVGEAVSFDGVNQSASVVNHSDLRSTSLTISFWVEATAHGTLNTVIAQSYTGGGSVAAGWYIYVDTSGVFRAVLGKNTGNVAGVDTETVSVNLSSLDISVFNHYVITYDGATIRAYLNGVATNTTTWASGLVYNAGSNNVHIGAFNIAGTPSNFFNGTIDDLKVFNRAISADEVQAIYVEDGGLIVDPQDYVARWELESNTTAPDSTYRGHDGTVNGSPVAVSAGVIGNALTFDGVDDYISIANHVDLRPTVLSVSAWVKTTSASNQTVAANFVDDGVTAQSGYILFLIGGLAAANIWSDTGYTLGTHGDGVAGTTAIDDDAWHHITCVYNSVDIRIYVDGVLEGTEVYSGGLAYDPTVVARIGNRITTVGSDAFYFNGSIDDVRLYSRALSATEIGHMFQSRIIAPPEDFVAEWNLESDGTESLGNHPATLVASPTFGAGWEGNAMTLNGSTQYGTVVDHADLKPTNVSVSAWVKTTFDSTGINQTLLHSGYEGDSNWAGYRLTIVNNGASLVIFNNTGGASPSIGVDFQQAYGAGPINDGDWHHIIGTYDGSTISLYIDGELITETVWTGLAYHTTNYVRVGARKWRTVSAEDWHFNGSIDKLQVFNRAVTAAEVAAMYNVVPVAAGGSFGLVEAWLTADDPTFTQPAAVAPVDYTALYTMDNADISAPTINDTSGSTNTHNATMIATPTTGETGQVGEAVLFNGTTQYATIVNHADFNVAAFTIAGWINLATVSADNDLFDNYNENTGATLIAGFRFYVTSTGKIALLVGKNTGLVSGTDFETAISSTSVDTEAWIHVAATYDGADIKVYISGILNGTTSWVGVDYTSALTRIAARSTAAITADKFFDGKVDDLKFYPRALSSDEISTINDKSFTEKTVKQLVIYEDTGVEATSPLLLHIDGATILPKTTESGKDLEVLWQGKGIARL